MYAVNEDYPVANKDEFFKQLNAEIGKIGMSGTVLGDFKRVGKKDKYNVTGSFGKTW